MTDSIANLLKGKNFQEPPEIAIIKRFLREKFAEQAKITVSEKQIVIGVSNSALAGTLRMHLHELEELCATDRQLIIRII